MKAKNVRLLCWILITLFVLGLAGAMRGQTATVTVNTTTKVTQPPVGVLTIDGAASFVITRGTGSPNGIVTASQGSMYLDQSGAVWFKQTGAGNSGWTQLGTGGTPPGGSSGQYQYNNGVGGFAGSTTVVQNGSELDINTSGLRFNDASDPTKQISLNLSNVPTSTTEDIVVPNSSNPVIVASDAGATNNFLTGINGLGVISKARPTIGNLADLSGASKLLGSASTGVPVVEITLGSNLSMSGSTLNAAAGSATPAPSNTYVQYNNANVFGGIPYLIYDGTTVQQTSGSRYTLSDSTTSSKKAQFDLSNITAANTRTINVPDANSTTVQPKAKTATQFLEAISAQGLVSAAQPAITDLQNLSGTSKLVGSSSSTSAPTSITLGTNLSMSGTTLNAGGSPGGSSGQYQYNNGSGGFSGSTTLVQNGSELDLNTSGLMFLDSSDPTKKLSFNLSNIPTSSTVSLLIPNPSGGTAVAVAPDAGATNNFLTGINGLGVISKAQPTIGNLANLSGTSKLVGSSDSSAAPTSITLGTNLSITGSTINAAGGGDVVGPASSTDFAYPMFNGTTGKLLQNSNMTGDGAGTVYVNHSASIAGALSSSLEMHSVYGGGPATNNFGTALDYYLESSTTDNRQAARVGAAWLDATDATRSAYMDFLLVNNATTWASKMRLFPDGGLSVNNTTDPGAGVISANTGFKIASTEFPIASNGIVKRTGANTYSAAVSGTDYEVPLTFSQSLNRATNTVTLLNDSGTPGNSQYYGTNASGTKGYFALPAGGGNVSNSGTPTVDQTSVWTDATHIKGVTTLKGGTTSNQVLKKVSAADYDYAWSQLQIGNLAALSSIKTLIGSNQSSSTITEISLGSGLDIVAGALTATSGGGNVSNSGTPTADQTAVWTDATHIKGVTTLKGGTLTTQFLKKNSATDYDYSWVRPQISDLTDVSSVKTLIGSSATGTSIVQIALGSGLDMTGTTLNVTSGGGNVSNSGTPTAGQLPIWTDATHIQGISTATYNAGTLSFQANATKFYDSGDNTKVVDFNVSNLTTGSTRDIVVANAGAGNSVTVAPDAGATNNFLTGISTVGAITKARPTIGNLTDLSTTQKLVGSNATLAAVTEITLGSGLSMTGSTLNVTAGGGNVSNSGTPTAGQAAIWTDATHIQGVSTLSNFVLDNSNNYTSSDSKFTLQNLAAPTKQANFNLSNITAGQTRSVNIPDANSTTIQPDTGAANNFLTAVSAQGVISKAQPVIANLSDATTVGQNFVKLTNPSAITFPRINADNTVSALDASTFRTAIGAGTGNGTVTTSGAPTTQLAKFSSSTAITNWSSSALSLIGRSANSTGDPADITATAASGAVMRESGSTIGFGTIATAGIGDSQVTYGKIQNVNANNLLGNPTGTAAAPSEISLASPMAFASNQLKINTNGISNSLIRQSAALSLIGRSSNSIGNVADITANAFSGAALVESSGSLAFGQIVTNGITDNNVTYGKLQAASAASTLIGSPSTGTALGEITLGTNLSMSGSTLNASGGGGAPGGSDTQVQYRVNSSTFGGISNATSDGTTMTLTSPKIVTAINDTNGNKILSLAPVGSAVNYLEIGNGAGDPSTVTIGSLGTASAVNIDMLPKAAAFEVKTDNSFAGHAEVLRLYHNRSAGGWDGLGTDIIVGGQTKGTGGAANVEMGGFQFEWSDSNHATRSSNLRLATVTNGVFNPWIQLFPTGGLSVRTDSTWTIDPGGGYISVENGYKIGATNIFPVATANGGVPSGGTTNQVLQKNSNTNYDVGWVTASGGGNVSNSGTPTSGQTAVWTDATHIQGVTTLAGGSLGQVLKKSSATDYDYAWGSVTAGAGGNNTEFQYNNGGALAGISSFTFDGTIPGTITLAPGANTVATGLFERNTTAATVGNPQHSPALRFQGHSWDTNPNADATRDWRIYAGEVSSYNAYDELTFDRSTDGGTGWTNLMKLSSYSGGSLFLNFNGGGNAMALGFQSNSAGFWNGTRGVTAAVSNTSSISFGSNNVGLGSNVILGWTTGANDPNGTIDTAFERVSAGVIGVNNFTAGQYRDILTRGLRSNAVTFANAIASPVDGTLQAFTDSSTNTQGATITGGGSNHVVGYYNGTNWIVTSGAGGGGGNVSNSGTPTADQLPIWTDDTHIKGVTVSGSGATISLANTGVITIGSIANASLSNSAITIGNAGSTSLGGTASLDSITGLSTTGIVTRTAANSLATITQPSSTVVGQSDTQTLTNKRVNPRTNAQASVTPWTPNGDNYDEEILTAVAADITINGPSGTPVQGQKLILRITSNASPHNLSWNGTYTAIGVTIPTTIAANKTIYIGCIWNSTLTRWEVVAVAVQA